VNKRNEKKFSFGVCLFGFHDFRLIGFFHPGTILAAAFVRSASFTYSAVFVIGASN